MSLFSALNLGRQTLFASQIGLKVAGNNIANADTPGYIREEVLLAPGPIQEQGALRLGTGVQVQSIRQQIDKLLEQRLRTATADLVGGETRDQVYTQLESLLQELGENDLSSSLNRFFSSVQDVLNQPEDPAVRNLAILQGTRLANDFRRLNDQTQTLRDDLNRQLIDGKNEINRLLEEIDDLNRRVVAAEQGGAIRSDAGALRNQRYQALMELAEFMPIRAREQSSGSVNVFLESEALIFEGTVREVDIDLTEDEHGLHAANLIISETRTPLSLQSGRMAGIVDARDSILGDFLSQLDQLAGSLIEQFNRVHSSGQGLIGYSELDAEHVVSDPTQPLDAVDLPFTPQSGTFQLLLHHRQTGTTERTAISVQLNGLDDDTTLESMAAQLDAIDGLKATVTEGRLSLASEDPFLEFAFENDTSGVLASLGVNTFFQGTDARDIAVSERLQAEPRLFAASQNGIRADSRNAEQLGALLTEGLAGQTALQNQYHDLVGGVTQAAAVSESITEGYRVFQQTLENEKQAKSGVNIDEEAIKLIAMQRMFQASAKYIATISELLDVLVQL